MLRQILPTLLILFASTATRAQETLTVPDVTVSATIQWTPNNDARLVVRAKVSEGLHIYAQTQPKPFLASKIDISDRSAVIESIGRFKPDRAPIRIKHAALGIELHEYEGTVQWTAPLHIDRSALTDQTTIRVEGTLFAQPCEKDRCFAPKNYPFTADWCLTCKTNEGTVIETAGVAGAIRESDTVNIRADKTQPNPTVDERLRKFGNSAAAIPLYPIFPAGNSNKPILLDGLSPPPIASLKRSRRNVIYLASPK